MILINLTKALLLTQVIEFTAAWIMGYREKRIYLAIFLINVITNPILNFIMQLNFTFNIFSYTPYFLLLLESIVVIVEWRLLVYILEKESKSCLLLSTGINIASFVFGLILFGI